MCGIAGMITTGREGPSADLLQSPQNPKTPSNNLRNNLFYLEN